LSRYEAIREECRAANAALPASGLVDLTFGNVSVCDRGLELLPSNPAAFPTRP
jgi:ribulose-5-phosphate 4-epimerase/fuculose-1-phosphate aldolase